MKNTEKAGGTRYSLGKPKGWWYAPLFGLRLVAEVWQGGSEKYAPLDWQQGQSFSSLFDSMSRHWLEIVFEGVWSRDDDSGAYHLAHLAWNALCLLTFMAKERHDLDDMTFWQGATAVQAADWRAEQGVESNFDVTDPQVGENLGRRDPKPPVASETELARLELAASEAGAKVWGEPGQVIRVGGPGQTIVRPDKHAPLVDKDIIGHRPATGKDRYV